MDRIPRWEIRAKLIESQFQRKENLAFLPSSTITDSESTLLVAPVSIKIAETGKSGKKEESDSKVGLSQATAKKSADNTVLDHSLTSRKISDSAKIPKKIFRSDLEHPQCWDRFDYGYLDFWNAAGKSFCEGSTGGLFCRVITNELLPVPTGPHVVCNASNLVIDYSKTHPIPCCKNRPGYFCVEPPTYTGYIKGALQSECQLTPAFGIDHFPRDHLRDIFETFEGVKKIDFTRKEEGVTFFVTRESGEHVNLFHSFTDFINIYQTMVMLGLEASDIAIVLLDDHTKGPFDVIFDQVFSWRKPMVRGSSLRGPNRIFYEQAVFVPPGYSSMVYSQLNGESKCPVLSNLFLSFSRFVLNQFGIQSRLEFVFLFSFVFLQSYRYQSSFYQPKTISN